MIARQRVRCALVDFCFVIFVIFLLLFFIFYLDMLVQMVCVYVL